MASMFDIADQYNLWNGAQHEPGEYPELIGTPPLSWSERYLVNNVCKPYGLRESPQEDEALRNFARSQKGRNRG